MKNALLILCFALIGGALFAQGQRDGCSDVETGWMPMERPVVTGGIAEIDVSSWPAELLDFVNEICGGNEGEICLDTEVMRVFAQPISGIRYFVFGQRENGELVVHIVLRNLSGEFALLGSYRGREIFDFFAPFLATRF